ncbi:Receptor protein kinase [Thalictrum thalictroides]|uniref:non-specific serine/threonine protein kinase n=1 Tax=Thalictrum thalictroides TaxID=46969 RepID=A0A7J6WW21_THATH|nr:Receptor protein kinase [Thalictrum thalictroides]
MVEHQWKIVFTVVLCFISVVFSATNPNDLRIMNEFRKGLDNPELLKWPEKDTDPCGTLSWQPHVFCKGDRVSQIQVQKLGLKGPLPQDFNQLTELYNLGLQRNNFNGKLPTFKGLSKLQFAYLGYNQFDTIPLDFAEGLDVLQVLSLDDNPLNKTTGWSIPTALQNSAQLTNLTLMGCNLIGNIPDFLGAMSSLTVLKLSYNNLTGQIPATFGDSNLQILWLNNQNGDGLSGPIDVIASMRSLSQLWLHGNQFTGTIPAGIGALDLVELNLNGNQLVGQIPESLADLESLQKVDLSNNNLMGAIPKFKSGNFSYSNNPLCQTVPGVSCSPQVTALINFLGGVSYPARLASSWKGNDPCQGPWVGINCNSAQKVSGIILPNYHLNGTLNPSVGELDSLTDVKLKGNNITGTIPKSMTSLKSLRSLDLSGNNVEPPLPQFSNSVALVVDGNPLLTKDNQSTTTPSQNTNSPDSQPRNPSFPNTASTSDSSSKQRNSKKSKLVVIVAPLASFVLLVLLLVPLSIYCSKKRKGHFQAPSSFVVHPRDPSDRENMVKIVVSDNINGSTSTATGSSSQSRFSSGIGESHVIESGNLVISVQVLRNVTKNFAPENELGRGGFGTVYKGELDDGTKIAVKRMEAGIISNKALDEFQSEIAVLSKVRHRHLVSLLGYSIEGIERLLVYEYMPQGALSRHLFHWESLKLEPLSWTRRLNIALDVARAMEYLHSLAQQSFIHRDLKSSNILLGDDYRAKVSDFGLVKLAPDGRTSVTTRLAGTFGYLAPEYAVTGKITTKADVFSFGVVLMELLTGLTALDEDRSEESRYLAAWFWNIKSSEEKLMAAIDKALDVNAETFESISIIAELAGHCTAREPGQRPDMGHAVNVLSPLVEKWKPFDDETEGYTGIDYNLPLTQMVKGWQEAEGKDNSYTGLADSKGSIPARPTGFAESFTSNDGR